MNNAQGNLVSGGTPPEDFSGLQLSSVQITYALVITVATLLLITCFLVASIFCLRRRYLDSVSGRTGSGTATVDEEAAARGLDEVTLESCPKMSYRWEKLFRSKSEAEHKGSCSICLTDFQEPLDSVRLMPECGHIFHADCVDNWLRANATCPICRSSPLPTPLAEQAPLRLVGARA